MLSVTMMLGGNRIEKLKRITAKSQLINSYEQIHSNNLSSNYFGDNRYQNLTVSFKSGAKVLAYQYIGEQRTSPVFKTEGIEELIINNISVFGEDEIYDDIKVLMTPYNLSCQLDNTQLSWGIMLFDLQTPDAAKTYCFALSSDNCRIREYDCKDDIEQVLSQSKTNEEVDT